MTTLTLHDYERDLRIEAERIGGTLTTKHTILPGDEDKDDPWTRVPVLRHADGREEVLNTGENNG